MISRFRTMTSTFGKMTEMVKRRDIEGIEMLLAEKKALCFGMIALLALLVYSNSFTAPFTLDDFGSIVNNYSIRNPLDFKAIWDFYSNRFILYFTLSINYFIHDTHVVGYHIVNTLIHIFNGILVFLVMRSLLGLKQFQDKLISKYSTMVSLVSALIFVCHPIQVNAVTYIVQRTASLAATFYLLAVYFYLRFRISDKAYYFVLTLLFTVMAMYTKENTITIPFMLILIEFMFFLKDGKTSWLKRAFIAFMLLLTVPIIPGTLLFLKGYSQSDPDVTFKASTSMNRMHYFYTQLNVILHYIRLLFVPIGQNFDYSDDYPISRSLLENNSYISLIILCMIGIFSLLNIKRNKLVSLGILWFFIGLSVESSFISIKDVYFEHRLYFPLAGFIMFVLGMIFDESRGDGTSKRYLFKKPLKVFVIFTCVAILFYSGLTLRRNYIYSDGIRLWSDVVKKAPNSDRAHSVLAGEYLNKYEETGATDQELFLLAEKEFLKAIELRYSNSTAHCNLAKLYLLNKQYDRCIEEARKAINLQPSVYAYHNLGSAYKAKGNLNEALKAFKAGYELDNRCTFILRDLGDTYYELKDYENSRFYYEEFLKYNIYRNSEEEVQKILESFPDNTK